MGMEAVFLGQNPAGEKVYEWLSDREDVEVKALLTEKEQLSLIEKLEPELVVSSGFKYRVPKEIIEIPEKGVVNLHPSFLPYNKGAHPYIWPIIEDTPAGVSIHYMNEGIDEGDLITRKEVEVRPDDTSGDLYDRLQEEIFSLFKEKWPELKRGADAKPQPEGGNYHEMRELDEVCEIDPDEEFRAGDLIDRLRALSFRDRKLAYFERNGRKYYLELDIEPE